MITIEAGKVSAEVRQALEALNGELGAFKINPYDPASIAAAILRAETLVDQRLGVHAADPAIAAIMEQLKGKICKDMFDQARSAVERNRLA